jgi:class 3 adenylate cyclase/tetratricopeptide (TPR) repeat protein
VKAKSDRNSITELIAWRRDAATWGDEPAPFIKFVRLSLDRGFSTLAYEIASEGRRRAPESNELAYLEALALARAQSTSLAGARVDQLLARLPGDAPLLADAYSLKGRVYKDWLIQLEDPERKSRLAMDSMANYLEAFRISNDFYPAINAAAMAEIAGDIDASKRYARIVIDLCEENIGDEDSDDYWLYASLGEAYLLLREPDVSHDWYKKAYRAAADDLGSIAAMRRQVVLLNDYVDVKHGILELLGVPRVLAFAGHMIDAPECTKPRFPPHLESVVRDRICDAIDRNGADYGYCSAACGSDILFIESMLERGAEVHVILPFPQDEFIDVSVRTGGNKWVDRFWNAIEHATSVEYATREGYLGDDVLFGYAANFFAGKAVFRARELSGTPLLLAVLETGDESLTGGTQETVMAWTRAGYETDVIDLKSIRQANAPPEAGVRGYSGSEISTARPYVSGHVGRMKRMLRTMIFADVVGFSKLEEEDAPSFFVDFLNEMAAAIDSQPTPPTFRNTWGDGLFLVYDDVVTAAGVAMSLKETVDRGKWMNAGLPEETSIRIGMHTGPVYDAEDPIIKQRNFYGSHVNRAARIEPVTTPGAIFVSEQTACFLEFSEQSEFVCDYLGPVPLAKGFDMAPLYKLRRVGEVT